MENGSLEENVIRIDAALLSKQAEITNKSCG